MSFERPPTVEVSSEIEDTMEMMKDKIISRLQKKASGLALEGAREEASGITDIMSMVEKGDIESAREFLKDELALLKFELDEQIKEAGKKMTSSMGMVTSKEKMDENAIMYKDALKGDVENFVNLLETMEGMKVEADKISKVSEQIEDLKSLLETV